MNAWERLGGAWSPEPAVLGGCALLLGLYLGLARPLTARALPFTAVEMERHRFSSQTFLPLDVARYLVLVAPNAEGGGPDMARARAFVADGSQGISYAAGTWHHPMTVFDRIGSFAVLTWLDGGPQDEQFVQLAEPVEIGG